MPSIQDTAYPHFKAKFSQRELEEIYTPDEEEIGFAVANTRGTVAKLSLLIMLKVFQRLGYFPLLADVPRPVIAHIARKLKISSIPGLAQYDQSGTRVRHMTMVRERLGITPYGEEGRRIIAEAVENAAKIKEDLADIINVAIEELVRRRYELPAFSALLRLAYEGRAKTNDGLYQKIHDALDDQARARIDSLFVVEPGAGKSAWNSLKNDPGKVTIDNLRRRARHVQWLRDYAAGTAALDRIPEVKVKQFSAEAKSLNASRMLETKPVKRYAITIALVSVQLATAIDDLGEMLIKLVAKAHQRAQSALSELKEKRRAETDELIDTLHRILSARKEAGSVQDFGEAIGNILAGREDKLIQACETHAVYAGNNYIPLLWTYHSARRKALFDILEAIEFISTTKDEALLDAVKFIQHHRKARKTKISVSDLPESMGIRRLDLSWVQERWERVVFSRKSERSKIDRTEVNRQEFELCVFQQLKDSLKSGDICMAGSDKYSDFRSQLISWDEYGLMAEEYGKIVDIPLDQDAFAVQAREWLESKAAKADRSFPDNEHVRFEQGLPVIRKAQRHPDTQGIRDLKEAIATRLKPVTILDVLLCTLKWVEWDKGFGPLSGFDSKLEDPALNYLLTLFCFGCNLGPAQTAKSVKGVTRHQLAWINQRHITEEKLNEAIVKLINAYNKFMLPRFWGSGESASVDGTKWDMYEQNLMAEYHIRYGGYGGVGYYHVSDTYIALFSHFIPCGVHEAIYLIDGLMKNESDIQPDTIHGDTHAQSETVFGLSYLLGIKLMPRIRNWKHLQFYRADRKSNYKHIDELFADHIDWELIRKYLPDMLRVAISIKAGRISASAILRRLGSSSNKNKLYQAFRELGRVVRTGFLLEYLDDKELRELIHAATCKSETFNKYAQWLLFGGEGVIKENNRDEQRKIIKYNHFVANALCLYNVHGMTGVLNELSAEGYPLTPELISSLSPYITSHVNRFGDYRMDFDVDIPKLEFDLTSMSALPNTPTYAVN